MAELDDELTGGEAARLLGVSRQQVSRLGHNGKLPGRQIAGRYWVFSKKDVLAYKAQPKDAGGRPPKSVRRPLDTVTPA